MRIAPLLLVGLCLLLFTASATTDLALPGPQDDEVKHGALAVDLLRPPFPYSRDYTLRLGDQPLPFGISPHSGAFKSYLLWPLFALFGPTVELNRGLSIFWGLLILIFSYRFLAEHAGRWPALVAIFFLALDSSFIFYSKLDEGPVVEILLWMVICLWSFARFGRTRQWEYLTIGLIAAVLGMYSHITFIWFVLPCFLAVPILFFKELRTLLNKRVLPLFIPAALCFLAIFFYWCIGNRRLLSNQPPGWTGVFVIFERLATQGGIVPEIFFGRFMNKNLPIPGIQTRPLTDLFLIASVPFLAYRQGLKSRFLRFCFLVALMMLGGIAFTPMGTVGSSMYRFHRLMPFYLFLIFFAGTSVYEAILSFVRFKREPWHVRLIALGLLLLALFSLGGQVALKWELDRAIRRMGGKGFWSDGIYSVAETLERGKWEKTICFDWGYASLVLLGKGKIPLGIPPWDVYTASDDERLRRLSQMMQKASPQVLFLLNPVRKYKGSVSVQELHETAEGIRKKVRLEYLFHDREGDPIYAAYTIHDAAY